MLSQKTRKRLSLFFAVCLAVAIMVAVMPGIQTKAAYTMKELEAFGNGGYTDNEILNDAVSQEIAAQSIVLLSNNGVLPLKDTTQIALFGNGATATVKGGTGSGIVNQRERDWIDTAFEAGANNLNGIEFSASDTSEAKAKALELAVEDAISKAEILAGAAGMKIAGINSIQEGGVYSYDRGVGYITKNMEASMDAAAGTVVQSAKLAVTANITVIFAVG